MRGPLFLLDMMKEALATPSNIVRTQEMLARIASILADAPPDKARYFLPGLSWPASEVYVTGGYPAILPGENKANTFEISTPGVVVGILISGMGTSDLGLDVEAVNLGWQLTRETRIRTSANISSSTSAGATEGYASVRGMTSQWPWMPLIIPARGAGAWTLDIKNFHATESIQPIANLAFLAGKEAFNRACMATHIPGEQG